MNTIANKAQQISFGPLRAWQAHQIDQAVRAVYRCWAKQHPAWAAAFFDEHFLTHKAATLLADFITGAKAADPLLLAGAWADQFPFTPTRRQQQVAELLPAVRAFLMLLKTAVETQNQTHWHWRGWRLWPWFSASSGNQPLCQE